MNRRQAGARPREQSEVNAPRRPQLADGSGENEGNEHRKVSGDITLAMLT
jgi:hypothetical protein